MPYEDPADDRADDVDGESVDADGFRCPLADPSVEVMDAAAERRMRCGTQRYGNRQAQAGRPGRGSRDVRAPCAMDSAASGAIAGRWDPVPVSAACGRRIRGP